MISAPFATRQVFELNKNVTHFSSIVLAVLISGGLMPIGNSKPLTFDPPRPPCASRTTVAPKWHVPHRERFGMVPQAPICRHE